MITKTQIELKKVTKIFKDGRTQNMVLKSIDLSIYSGESITIEGASGSGKSTLLKIIAGIISPTIGEIC